MQIVNLQKEEQPTDWTMEQLEALRENSECWYCSGHKLGRTTHTLGRLQTYEHEGGIIIPNHPVSAQRKWWAYFVCSRCHYQWAWWKLVRRLTEIKYADIRQLSEHTNE